MKSKLLIVALSLLPFFSIGQNQEAKPVLRVGSGTSRIWAPEFRSIESVSVTLSDFSKSNYTVKEFTVFVLSNETKTYKTVKNIGSKLNDEIKHLFFTLKSNDSILITDISAKDSFEKTIYLDDRFFRVR